MKGYQKKLLYFGNVSKNEKKTHLISTICRNIKMIFAFSVSTKYKNFLRL